jgi:hypothetical protein
MNNLKEAEMDRYELLEHYDFYVENCTKNEIPLKFKEWESEYKNDLLIILKNLEDD